MSIYIISTLISALFCFFACLFYREMQKYICISGGIYKNRAIMFKAIYLLFVFLSGLPLFLVSAFRYRLGTDYMFTYVPQFYRILFNDKNHYSFGFYLINKLVILFTQDPTWLFILCAAIFIYFVYNSIYKNSPYPVLSIVLLLVTGHFFLYLNLMRQYVAMAILLFSIQYVVNRKMMHFIICILIASSIHLSALVFIPVYFFGKVKFDIKKSVILVVLGSAFALSITSLFSYFLKFSEYQAYIGSIYDTHQKSHILLVENIIFFVLFCCIYYKSKYKEKLYLYMNIQTIAVLLTVLIGRLPLVDRVCYYYTFIQIISIPFALKEVKSQSMRWCFIIMILVFLSAITYYVTIIRGDNQVIPYNSVFQAGIW